MNYLLLAKILNKFGQVIFSNFWLDCTMADKENFSVDFFFYLSPLLEDLRNLVHRSIDIYVIKNSGYIHMTSRVDLYRLRSQVLDIVSNHPF